MTEIESIVFGKPNSLLCPPASQSNAIQEVPQVLESFAGGDLLREDTFVMGELLGGENQSISTMMESSEHLEGQSIPNESFVHTGLLSANVNDHEGSTGSQLAIDASVSGSSFTQRQDEEFPDVAELLRPYAKSSIFPPTNSTVLRAATSEGHTIFLTRKPRRRERLIPRTGVSVDNNGKFRQLLDVPIHRLLDDLSVSAAAKLAQSDVQPAVADVAGPSHLNTTADASLWVDRYRPQRFTDLLGDDRVHREVMAWVKEWDWCVFGRRKARGRKRPRDEDGDNSDEWRRPQEKLLLLSGPPGLGKTTLAHVVAQHAGYSVFEINASDARSADVVDERIRPALESGSAVGSTKPILVVIDEIDGATGGSDNSGGFIHKLIQLTYDKSKKGRKADPKATRPLLRPIICICNDLYASSLTKLRQHARIVRFSRPNDVHLVRRLREICEIESLPAESRALTTLVGVAQGDFRGCLNTLQMLKARNRNVTEAIVRNATQGMKEAESSQTVVLNDLFSPLARKRARDLGMGEEDEIRYIARLSREVDGSGAMDKIALGCFEHYANLHRHDANFTRYLKANEWLSTFDVMSGQMRSEREYSLLQYLPYHLVAFYPLFQERGAQKVERPKADWESHMITKMNEEIYKSLARCLRTAGNRHAGDFLHLVNEKILQLELAPMLNRIISPPLRPVNSQVIKPGEKLILSRLVDIMASMELRFMQEKTEDGQLVYRLDPPIDVFITYDGKRASDISVSRYAVRHLVAAEIDARLIAHHADGLEKGKGKKADFFGKKSMKTGDSMENLQSGNKHQKTEPAEKVATDFFGRPIVATAGDNEKKTGGKMAEKYRVTYRFKEGNSAAVRKPIKVAAFL